MPNCAGGMTIVQLGADRCNEGHADECRQVLTNADKCRRVQTSVDSVQTSADKCRRVQTSVDSVQTESEVVYTP